MLKTLTKSLTLAFFLVAVGGMNAQNPNELELIKSRFSTEKMTLAQDFMNLSPEEGAVFWPIYREYEAERSVVADRRIRLLYEYGQTYSSMSNAQADAWVKKILSLWQSELAIKKKYYKRISKKLTPLLALRFFQMEELIQVEVRSLILENMPLLNKY